MSRRDLLTLSPSITVAYNDLLDSDRNLTKPVAAINALIALLNTAPSSTVHETLDIIKTNTERLRSIIPNSLALTAGTDLFRAYILANLKQQDGNFEAVRQHLLRNSRLFAHRAAAEREGIAQAGFHKVTSGCTVLTHGASRCVVGLLERAARTRAGTFKVIYVKDESRPKENDRVVRELQGYGIPTAVISSTAVAHVIGLLRKVDVVMVGAEVVMQSGGIISRIGTFQIAQIAQTKRIPFYVCAETHKFNRRHIYDQHDWGKFRQQVLDFSVDGAKQCPEDAVDFTVGLTWFRI